jgi:uncharacterized protein (PEP-CTERM system associated)
LIIAPSLSISEMLTNNNRLSGGSAGADAITQISPAIHIAGTSSRIKGFFDYSLNGLIYARSSGSNELQNALNGAGQIEAIENFAFVDVSANISQQLLSAFGTRSADSASINSNRTEVRSYSVSPYVRGRLSDFAAYDARLTYGGSRSGDNDAANSESWQAFLRLGGDNSARFVNWSVDASRSVVGYDVGPRSVDDRLRGIAYLAVDPSLRLSLIAGRESNNLLTGEAETHNTPGWGVDWTPTERTRISAVREQRFFGKSHAVLFEHRTPRSVWRYSDSRDISTGLGQPTLGQVGTIYDLFFAQFASLQPDPALRGQLVNEFLARNGVSATTPIFAQVLASTVTLQRRRDLSLALIGLRTTITFIGSQSEVRRLVDTVNVADDFSNGNTVRQRGFSAQVAHRLTPESSLSFIASLDRANGTTDSRSTKLLSFNAFWTTQLGSRTGLSLGARHAVFDGSSNDSYTESALTATVTYRF